MKILTEGIKPEKWEEELVCSECKARLLVSENDLYLIERVRYGSVVGKENYKSVNFSCPCCNKENEIADIMRRGGTIFHGKVTIYKKEFFERKNGDQRKESKVILTVDLAITINGSDILLIERAKGPFMDKLVLPGGHFENFEKSLKKACAREMLEELDLKIDPKKLRLLTVLDERNRDPREGRRASVVFTVNFPSRRYIEKCFPGSDAKAIQIRKVNSLTKEEIGFDHWKVIEMIKQRTRK